MRVAISEDDEVHLRGDQTENLWRCLFVTISFIFPYLQCKVHVCTNNNNNKNYNIVST